MSHQSDPAVPKLLLCLRDYSLRTLVSDLIAGVTVGLVALPLAMAFAIASGLPPQSGIYTAIVAGFLISALGGSRTQIGGPTGAFVVVVSGIVATHGPDGLLTCTVMAGAILVVLGLTGLGTAVKYIPRPVVIGFTNGIAVLIASTQVRDLLGLRMESAPPDFLGRLREILLHLDTASPVTALLAAGSLAVILAMRHFYPKVPGTIVALLGGTLVAALLNLPVDTIGSRFGDIPRGLPSITLPVFRLESVLELLSPIITVAMLGAIESLLSAVVADRMSGDRHNPNVELFAQGIANVLSPLVGGLPATGAIARTATNIRSGARTPIAGIIHALTLLVILLTAAPLAGHIPFAVLAAILLVVAYNMGEWCEIPTILRLSRSSIAVWALTFALTVFADLTVAVEAGMAMATLLYIRKVSNTTRVIEITPERVALDAEHSLHLNPLPVGAKMYSILGPFLFGATEKLSLITDDIASLPPIVILRLRNMNAIDATGLHALEDLATILHRSERTLIVCGMREQPRQLLGKAEFHDVVGDPNVCDTLRQAVQRAEQLLRAR